MVNGGNLDGCADAMVGRLMAAAERRLAQQRRAVGSLILARAPHYTLLWPCGPGRLWSHTEADAEAYVTFGRGMFIIINVQFLKIV